MSENTGHHFDHLLLRKPLLRVREVAELFQVSDTTIRNLIEEGQLPCHEFNAAAGLRMTRRVPRQAVVLLLLKSKSYDMKDYLSSILALLATLSAPELEVIRDQLPSLAARAVTREPASHLPSKHK